MDSCLVTISCEHYEDEACECREVPCGDISTGQDGADDKQEVWERKTVHMENLIVEQDDTGVTERRTEDSAFDKDVSCSPEMSGSPCVAVDMMVEEGETTTRNVPHVEPDKVYQYCDAKWMKIYIHGGAENVVSIKKRMKGSRHLESVLNCSSATVTDDVNLILPHDQHSNQLVTKLREEERDRNRERDKQNENDEGGNNEKEQWKEGQPGCQGSFPGSPPLPWKEKEFESTDQGKGNSGDPIKEPRTYQRRDINQKPERVVGERVKKKHIADLIFCVNSFTPFGVLKVLLLYLVTTGALLKPCSGAPLLGFSCMNDPRDQNAVLCSCTTVGDGSHIWEFDWSTTCTRDELFFSPRQPEPKSCYSSGALIEGHGNTTNGYFESELAFRINDTNFHGVVNCSVLRSGDHSEVIGQYTLSAPSVVCQSVNVDDGILTIQLVEDPHRLTSNRLTGMLKHNHTNITTVIEDTQAYGAMQIIASLGDLGLEVGYYSIDVKVANNIDSFVVHCKEMVFHPAGDSTTNSGADSTLITVPTVSSSAVLCFHPLCLVIGILLYISMISGTLSLGGCSF